MSAYTPASFQISRDFYKQRVELFFRKLFRIGWRRETVCDYRQYINYRMCWRAVNSFLQR